MDSKSPHISGAAADESPMLDSSTNTTSGHDNTDLNNHLMEQVRDLFTLASNIVKGQGYSEVSEDQLRLKKKAEELREELDATKKTLAATGRELGIVKMQIEDVFTMRRVSLRQTMST
ncbi:hypothetical protein K4K53_005644 [Colletotrichum sp. SAR 10_77]|nr:hypothetical protein K4K53_005644 [Colletotrichum sp. SAR 10_77]